MESGVLCAVSCHYIVLDYSQTSEVDLFRSSPPSPPLLQVSGRLKIEATGSLWRNRFVKSRFVGLPSHQAKLWTSSIGILLQVLTTQQQFPQPFILSYPILSSSPFFFLIIFFFSHLSFISSTLTQPTKYHWITKKGHSLHTSLHFSCSSSHQKKLL